MDFAGGGSLTAVFSLLSIHVRIVITDVDDFRKTLLKILREYFHLLVYEPEVLAGEEEAVRKEVAVVCVDMRYGRFPDTEGQCGGADLTQVIVL